MQRTGEVTAIHGKMLEITFCRPSDCEKCNACHGGQKVMNLRLKGHARVGDKVVVSLPASTVTRASVIVYLIPLVCLFLGMALGNRYIPLAHSLGAILGGAVGVGIPALVLALTEKRRQADPKWRPQLVRVIPAASEE